MALLAIMVRFFDGPEDGLTDYLFLLAIHLARERKVALAAISEVSIPKIKRVCSECDAVIGALRHCITCRFCFSIDVSCGSASGLLHLYPLSILPQWPGGLEWLVQRRVSIEPGRYDG